MLGRCERAWSGGRQRAVRQRAARGREEREEGGEGGKRKWKKKRKKEKERNREREKEKERERERKSERTPARFAVGGRAWATGSRAARDGTAARKKRGSEVQSAEK